MREAVINIGDEDLEALGIGELVSICHSAGLRDFEEFACYGNGAVVQVEVDSPIDIAALRELDYVDRIESLNASGNVERYLIAFTSPTLSEAIASHADDLVGTCDPDLGDEGVTMSFVGPQRAIRGTVSEYRSAGVAPDLKQIGDFSGSDHPLEALTDRQREVVHRAFDMGYYDVPRRVSTRDVADELGLDASTVAEHLQRAERNLLSQHLSSDP